MNEKLVGERPTLLVTLLDEVLMPRTDLKLPILATELPHVRRKLRDIRPAVRLLRRIDINSEQCPKKVVNSFRRKVLQVNRDYRNVFGWNQRRANVRQELLRCDNGMLGLGRNRIPQAVRKPRNHFLTGEFALIGMGRARVVTHVVNMAQALAVDIRKQVNSGTSVNQRKIVQQAKIIFRLQA